MSQTAQTVKYSTFPSNDAGIIQNTQKLVGIVEKDSRNFDNIRFARGICEDFGTNNKIAVEKADAIFCWMKENIRYQFDPVTVELYQDTQTTLKEGIGDCDDFVILGMTLNACVGNVSRACLIAADNDTDIDHIYYEVLLEDGNWRAYDATVDEATPGWKPKPNAKRHYVYLDGTVGTGFIDKIFKELRRFFRKFEKNIIRRPFAEIKRFAKKNFKDIYEPISRIGRELRRFKDKVTEEIADILQDITGNLGPLQGLVNTALKAVIAFAAGQIAGALIKSLFSAATTGSVGGINAVSTGVSRVAISSTLIQDVAFASLTVPEGSPLEMSAEEWNTLLSIALTIISAGAAAVGNVALVAVTQIAQTAKSAVDVSNAISEKEKLLDELKKVRAQVLIQAQAQKEVILKLEHDIALLKKFQGRQAEYEKALAALREENNQQLKNFRAQKQLESQTRIQEYKEILNAKREEIKNFAKRIAS